MHNFIYILYIIYIIFLYTHCTIIHTIQCIRSSAREHGGSGMYQEINRLITAVLTYLSHIFGRFIIPYQNPVHMHNSFRFDLFLIFSLKPPPPPTSTITSTISVFTFRHGSKLGASDRLEVVRLISRLHKMVQAGEMCKVCEMI